MIERRHFVLSAAALAVLPARAFAAPVRYILDPARSVVGFIYAFDGQQVNGRLPVLDSKITLDFADLGRSRAAIVIGTAKAQGGFPFATQALRGPKMFDARRFPEARFVSRRFRRIGDKATVTGDLTIRDITRPVTLDVSLFRQKGTPEGSLDHLSLLIEGQVNRHDFGLSGFPDMVDPTVTLRILVRIDRDGA